jgi:transposase
MNMNEVYEKMMVFNRFDVIRVNPKYTSQTCPVCGFISRGNRKNESFKCLECGFVGHADHVGAINISERVPKDNPYLKPTRRNDLL